MAGLRWVSKPPAQDGRRGSQDVARLMIVVGIVLLVLASLLAIFAL